MSTLVLKTVGSVVGGALFGPLGATLGGALGGLGGAVLDQALLGEGEQTGPRLQDVSVQSSTEGVAIPRLFGRMRIPGQIIWATELEEIVSKEQAGGKGGPTIRQYQYFANLAIGLCEGPIAEVLQVWADGEPLDMRQVSMRVYHGTETQAPDALIAAKQQGHAPAYRGLAYVVFERLALAGFGNRIPQFTFEVVRVTGKLEKNTRAITLIPGAGEFVYDPDPVQVEEEAGQVRIANRHVLQADTDWQAALDNLQALFPNLEQVALVVSWFGDDLRANTCRIYPAVDHREKVTPQISWSVAGQSRKDARLISQIDGKPAYGGTPSDQSVIRAIADLKKRGLGVTLYPFIMMDIGPDNALPNPYDTASGQPAYPWRGRITASVAPGRSGSPVGTTAVVSEIAGFFGPTEIADIIADQAGIRSVRENDWSYRRFILHYAKLAVAAGGVDAFLIGSELKGLTTLKADGVAFPAVSQLARLAGDVKSIVGTNCKVTYGADWSEYANCKPIPGSEDLYFHLDELWAHNAIDCVGIDYYMPLADWRDTPDHRDRDLSDTPYDPAYIQANIAGGEAYDWYYASDADRAAQIRTPIEDGAFSKPWVYRAKDLVNWWANPHHHRINGQELDEATAWVPQSKPIWLTELGCPAVDKGANAPNVFPDPKSSENRLPPFSNGNRDDTIQRVMLEACLDYWQKSAGTAQNPVSPIYQAPMLLPASIYLWTWDARPFPAFPGYQDAWTDVPNWAKGHWLCGRAGEVPLANLFEDCAAAFGIRDVVVSQVAGSVSGFLVPSLMSYRAAISDMLSAFGLTIAISDDTIRMTGQYGRAVDHVGNKDFVAEDGQPVFAFSRLEQAELPTELVLRFYDTSLDYRPGTASVSLAAGRHQKQAVLDVQAALHPEQARKLVDMRMQDLWADREEVRFALGREALALEPGDQITIELDDERIRAGITQIEDGAHRAIVAKCIDLDRLQNRQMIPQADTAHRLKPPPISGPPSVLIADLPARDERHPAQYPFVAVSATPWPGEVALYHRLDQSTLEPLLTLEKRASIGHLVSALAPGPVDRWDRANHCIVRLASGLLASQPDMQVFAGKNLAAIQTTGGGWEVIQFSHAELVARNTYRLSNLLRGRGGTRDQTMAGSAEGAAFILLDEAVAPMPVAADMITTQLDMRAVPTGYPIGGAETRTLTYTATARGLRPLAPVHAALMKEDNGDLLIRWIRQTRFAGESWVGQEVPLHEEREAYEVSILKEGNAIRSLSVTEPAYRYELSKQMADFGGPQRVVQVEISQTSSQIGAGLPLRQTLEI